MNLPSLAILFACFAACLGEKARFDNYRVYSIEIENVQQLDILKQIENGQDGISFFKSPTGIHQKIDVLVPPHKFADIHELFQELELKIDLKIENLQK